MSDELSGNDPYDVVIADLLRQRDEIDAAIQAIQRVHAKVAAGSASGQPAPSAARPEATGDFLGLSIAEAAKKLLSLRRRTMTTSEIAEGLKSAGYPMTAAEPGNVVGSVLSRRFDNVGDVVRVARGQWGLLEWYPNRSFRKKDKEGNGKKADQEPMPSEHHNLTDQLHDLMGNLTSNS